jgi:ribosomal protein S18 acetylase RimI-like enzyme
LGSRYLRRVGIEIRKADPVADARFMGAVDTSFETRTVFDVQSREDGFALIERPADTPVRKTFPVDDLGEDRQWDSAWVAFDGETPIGFVATQYEQWNRRVVIWHFYVSSSHRGRGIGRRLLETALDAAREAGARRAWLETSNLNVPGVQAYRRLGFELVGLDVSLYRNTPAERETALFLGRELD